MGGKQRRGKRGKKREGHRERGRWRGEKGRKEREEGGNILYGAVSLSMPTLVC